MDVLPQITRFITIYMAVGFVPLGFIFNVMAGAIFFSRPCFRNGPNTMGFQLGVITIADTCCLLYYTGLLVAGPLFGFNIQVFSDVSCSFSKYSQRVILQFTSWLKVMLVFHRYLTVAHSAFFSRFIKEKKFVVLGALLILAVILIANAEVLLYYVKQTPVSPNSTAVSLTCASQISIFIAADTVSILLRTILPFIIMAVLSLLILRILKTSKANVKHSQANVLEHRSLNKREHHFTRTVIALNAIFLGINFPFTVCIIFSDLITLNVLMSSGVPKQVFDLIYSVSQTLSGYHYGLLFFENMVFNKVFRREVSFVFGQLVRCKPSLSLLLHSKSGIHSLEHHSNMHSPTK